MGEALTWQELRKDNLRIVRLEEFYMQQSRRNIYVACEDMDFVWDERDVEEFDRMWQEGFSIWDIARAFNRDPDEVALLAMDRARKRKIKKRKNGVFGRRMRA
ncbi:hypothetical protein BSNK01_12340 [Bacillaceae bacterium]